ncbi:MAG: hypothetical protein M1831_006117 [Alyxoria varia]|nr:MAG: hypothetical protein M1831_006117 [Alyxoria varia]
MSQPSRITPSTRLRRALHLRSLPLVQRIILSNPQTPELVRNPDFSENNETSLHLAAKHGLPEVAAFLVHHGHEKDGISRTEDGQTPLMVAAAAGSEEDDPTTLGRIEVGRLLIERFPEYVNIRDKQGLNAFSHAARSGTDALIVLLLSRPPPPPPVYDTESVDDHAGKVSTANHANANGAHPLLRSLDKNRNTPLHHASAFGHLKTVKILISAGADDTAKNEDKWTPEAYSSSVAAEVYYRGLIKERDQSFQQRQGAARLRGTSDEKTRQVKPGIRMVRSGEGENDEMEQTEIIRRRARART